jgi:hypothetical protein
MSDDPRLFTLTGPDGEAIARGSMSAVTEPLLDSKARGRRDPTLDRCGAGLRSHRKHCRA